MSDYADWPFWPDSRTDDQQARWWDTCYVAAAADLRLRGVYHWFLLTGSPGSGKSIARMAWQRREAARSLVLAYPPERWPGSPAAWFPDNSNHLAQMMATAGLAVAEQLQRQPHHIAALDPFQREFLRALLEFMGGERHYRRFVAALPTEWADALLSVAVTTDFFGDGRTLRGVQAQIEELSQLLRGLEHERVVFAIDPPTPLGPAHVARLADLFGWLDLADNPGFAVAAVVPDGLLTPGGLLARARGRAGLVNTDWTDEECRRVAERHLHQAAPDAPPDGLAALLPKGALAELAALVAAECGRPNPAAWVALTETLLYLTRRTPNRLPTPLRPDDLPRLKATYFSRHVQLRLDPDRRAVWRGTRLIPLDEQPFRFLQLLHQRGRTVNWDDDDLRLLAHTKGNVHSIASRARRAIEPVEEQEVYLHNKRGDDGGYWLENGVLTGS